MLFTQRMHHVLTCIMIALLASCQPENKNSFLRGNSNAICFEKDTLDLGPIRNNKTIHTQINLINHSASTQKILGLKSECNCTVQFTTDSIPPSATQALNIQFSPSGADTGTIYRHIAIRTTSPEPFKIFVLKAKLL